MAALNVDSYPLWNTSWHMHNVSPLYKIETPLNNHSLKIHAARFRDKLTGPHGGVGAFGREQDSGPAFGKLEEVSWRVLPEPTDWDQEATMLAEDSALVAVQERGVIIVISYEQAQYTALLLRNTEDDGNTEIDNGSREHYPLLLTKMPSFLREELVDYISNTFDAAVTPPHISKSPVLQAFHDYIFNITHTEGVEIDTNTDPQGRLSRVIKDVVLSLRVDVGPSNLKTAITIASEDLWAFSQRGDVFQTALANYITETMALDITRPEVCFDGIACGAFILSEKGQVKLFRPLDDNQADATTTLLGVLISGGLGENRRL